MSNKRKTPEQVRVEMIERLKIDVVPKAIAGLESVLDNPKSQPSATATAATTVLKLAGYLQPDGSTGTEKQLYEMDGIELRQHMARLEAELAALPRRDDSDDDAEDAGCFS